jgi:hypothetical protein
MYQEKPCITVRGIGRASIPPDRTVVTFNTSAIDRDYAESADELNRRVAGLRQRLEKAGIPGKDLKTTTFTITPEHEYRGTGDNRHTVFVGWRARHALRLELPVDRDLLNRAFSAITVEDFEASLSVGFEVSDPESMRTMILEDATRNACRNAEAIAKAAGCKLGRAVKIDYSWSEIRYHGMAYELTDAVASASRAAPDIEPDDIEGSDSVTIVFDLEA